MKNIKYVMALTLLILSSKISAQKEPDKPIFEPVMMQEESKIYIQKGLPIYLSISTSKGGEAINLETPTHPQDANPMFLDTEGINYIRSKWAIDPETKAYSNPRREILFPVYADGLAPKTRVVFSGASKYVGGGTTFFGPGLLFDLPAQESMSGLSKTFFSEKGQYVEYAESKSKMDTEGAHHLFFFSVDKVGNSEQTRSSSFTIDITAPETTGNFIGVKVGDVVGPSTQFSLAAKDNLSGVHATYIHLNDSKKASYSRPLLMTSLAEGPYQINYNSVDNVKNEEASKKEEIFLDKTAPVSRLKIIGDKYEGNLTFVSERTDFNLAATDNKAGVKEIYFSTPSIEEKIFRDNFKLSDPLGLKSINFFAVDRVSNTEKLKKEIFFMDNKPPSTSINFGNPSFFARDTLFINEETKISLIVRDGESGPQKSQYKLNDGNNMEYSEPFVFTNEGHKRIEIFSTDNVNNVETPKYSAAYVDNSPPEIFINFGLEKIGMEDGMAIYPNYIRMFLGATDDKTGIKEILYTINGSDYMTYSSPKTIDLSEKGAFTSSKKYEIKVIARDMLGNEMNKTLSFLVKDQ